MNFAPALSGGQVGTLTYGYDAVSNETFEHDTNVVGTLTASRRNLESYRYDAIPVRFSLQAHLQ
ncbi:MAG: hypothetical protein IT461_10365 [Planctomycetes bacterium]|jgi:hypothetical protein|nr:hypothetical protein [Planctomycetota bacterium]